MPGPLSKAMPANGDLIAPSTCPWRFLGTAWTLLLVRDLMLKGRTRFGELLEGGEGIASNIRSDPLSRLETHALVQRHRDPADARRFTYRFPPNPWIEQHRFS
jgi:DNA-binding HxlR family transcriptional regulator